MTGELQVGDSPLAGAGVYLNRRRAASLVRRRPRHRARRLFLRRRRRASTGVTSASSCSTSTASARSRSPVPAASLQHHVRRTAEGRASAPSTTRSSGSSPLNRPTSFAWKASGRRRVRRIPRPRGADGRPPRRHRRTRTPSCPTTTRPIPAASTRSSSTPASSSRCSPPPCSRPSARSAPSRPASPPSKGRRDGAPRQRRRLHRARHHRQPRRHPGRRHRRVRPLPVRLADATADTTIVSSPAIKATLDAAGHFTVACRPPTTPTSTRIDWTYRVSVRTKHLPYYFNMAAPAGGDVDLTDVTPIVASEGNAVIVGPPGPEMTLVEDPPGTAALRPQDGVTMATRLDRH